MESCGWAAVTEAMQRYHDEEWCVPSHDDRELFELLMLEALQCGLSWRLIIDRREAIRTALAGFDFERLAAFTPEDEAAALAVPGMLRSPRKMAAMVKNARAFVGMRQEFGSFSDWLWSFTDGKAVVCRGHEAEFPAENALSGRIAKELKKRGFAYLGAVTVYSFLQAAGVINDHGAACPLRAKILASCAWREEDDDWEGQKDICCRKINADEKLLSEKKR